MAGLRHDAALGGVGDRGRRCQARPKAVAGVGSLFRPDQAGALYDKRDGVTR